ncbi:MAG: hypothetical protein AAGC55_18875 [Myxococcota bacterium]
MALLLVLRSPSAPADGQESQDAVAGQAKPAEGGEASAQMEQTVSGLKSRARQVAEQRRAERSGDSKSAGPSAADIDPAEERHGYPAKTIATASEVFDDMMDVRGLINTQQLRREAAGKLLLEPRALDLVVNAVSDPQFARKVFGEKQAEARFFGIKVIEHAASQGNTDALLNAIKAVSQNLINSPEFDEGLAEDLRGLVTAYARLLPEEQLTPQTLAEIGYSDALSMPIRQQYYDGFMTALWDRFGLEKSNERLAVMFGVQQPLQAPPPPQ